jgi:hypothetical protein
MYPAVVIKPELDSGGVQIPQRVAPVDISGRIAVPRHNGRGMGCNQRRGAVGLGAASEPSPLISGVGGMRVDGMGVDGMGFGGRSSQVFCTGGMGGAGRGEIDPPGPTGGIVNGVLCDATARLLVE